MTTKELEQAILELISTIYCKEYIGRIAVIETFTDDKEHLGYLLKLGLNKDEKPLAIAWEGSKEDYLPFIKEELKRLGLDLTKYFTAIQLYKGDE